MTDTIKRLAGPVAPVQISAGTDLYAPAGAVKGAVKNVLVHNSDPVMGAFFTLGLNDLTVMSNHIYTAYYVPPGETEYLPVDLVLTSSDTLKARQSCMIEPSQLTIAAAVAAKNAGSAASITSATWTEALNDLLLLTVGMKHATAVGNVSGFTDTHTGITWTLLQTKVNAANTARISQYIAKSGGTTNTTTQVSFDFTASASALAIDKITAVSSYLQDASGSNAANAFRGLGGSEAPPGTTPYFTAAELGASVLEAHIALAAGDTNSAMTGWTEVDDFGTTNAMTISTQLYLAPASWIRPTLVTGTTPLGIFAELLNTKRTLVVTANGVENS